MSQPLPPGSETERGDRPLTMRPPLRGFAPVAGVTPDQTHQTQQRTRRGSIHALRGNTYSRQGGSPAGQPGVAERVRRNRAPDWFSAQDVGWEPWEREAALAA
jgi:hypothetical protein